MNWHKRFSVLGSDGCTIYYIDFTFSDSRVVVSCNCPAGKVGKICKHKTLLLDSRSEILIDKQQVDELNVMLLQIRDQPLFRELELFRQAEAVHEASAISLNVAKKRFEQVMKG